jgi:hypothetical protein
VIDYRSFTIQPKRDFGPEGFYLDGKFTKVGYVVVKDGCNPMPGAVWFRSIEAAKEAVDDLIETGGKRIWRRTDDTGGLACALERSSS